MSSDILTTRDVAKRLQISQTHVGRLINNGTIHGAIRLGPNWFVPRSELKRVRPLLGKVGRPRRPRTN